MDTIESLYSHIADIHVKNVTSCPTDFLPDVNPYKTIGDFFSFIYAQYVGKYKELLEAVIDNTNSGNYIVSSMVGRSIVETTAALRYYNIECEKSIRAIAELEKAGKSPFDPDAMSELMGLVNQHMKGSKFDWSAFFSTDTRAFVDNLIKREADKKNASPVEYPESLRIRKMLAPWEAEMPELRFIYAFFSDLVHPNLGSNLLLIGLKDGKIQIGGDSNKSVGKRIATECVRFLAPILKEASKQLFLALRLSGLGQVPNS
jgi:hypothetical protein